MATIALRAEVVVSSDLLVRCMIDGRRVDLHPLHLQPGTTVERAGDTGVVVIPDWLADALELGSSVRLKA
jgi:hypothetical protein